MAKPDSPGDYELFNLGAVIVYIEKSVLSDNPDGISFVMMNKGPFQLTFRKESPGE